MRLEDEQHFTRVTKRDAGAAMDLTFQHQPKPGIIACQGLDKHRQLAFNKMN